MSLIFEEEVTVDFDFDYKAIALEVINESLNFLDFPYECEVSLTLTDNASIHEINKEYRQIDSPTDVLSFPLVEYNEPGEFSVFDETDEYTNPDTGEIMLGDIVISVDRVVSQAEEYGHSKKREYAFLIAHSMLHLMGFDHIDDDERLEMEEKQEQILTNLHIKRDEEV